MKVCIVTVYNSINSGSYWQAHALEIYLEKEKHDVYFLKRNNYGASSSNLKIFKTLLLLSLRFKFKELKNFYNTVKEFKKLEHKFKIINNRNIDDIDLFILGSDTIWNLDSKYFVDNRKIYFGGIFPKNKVASFAASIANTNYDILLKYNDVNNYINRLAKIGVRDTYTKNMIEKFTKNNVELVCDPTLLLEKKDYEKLITEIKDNDYIFIYLFKNLNDSYIDEIKKFAKNKNLKIISGTRFFTWCDECIINTPHNFINYMYNANYIITDTFHGTVFSINLNKKFVSINREKNKVNEFLNKCELTDRLISNYGLSEILEAEIDYKKVNLILKDFRNYSIKFLNDLLKK